MLSGQRSSISRYDRASPVEAVVQTALHGVLVVVGTAENAEIGGA